VSYIYPIEAAAMFEDRMAQILGFGIPEDDVKALRAGINDMWADAPGGWVYEWSQVAQRYAANGHAYLAAMAYGWAKFPCLANEARRKALDHEVEKYVEASKTFPVRFERRILKLPYAGGMVDVPVHLLGGPEDRKKAPVLMASGGVDTWKMDVHPVLVALAKGTGFTVLAFDHPGTGETCVPLNTEADEVVLGLAREARAIGDGRVAHFGMSFGGNFAAMTGLSGAVDAAVSLGGPVRDAFTEENLSRLPYGMKDIVGNAFGFDRQPEFGEILKRGAELSRAALLNERKNSPMLVINGADDYFVPQEDTLVFKDRPQTEVQLIPGTGHCAMSKLGDVMPAIVGWLRAWAARTSW
jgi:esterase FrsA